MIDIHAHILPDIDDGAKNENESLAMAKIAVLDGITKIIATPHVIAGLYENQKPDIIQLVKDLNALLALENIPLEILPGAEYRLEPELPDKLQKGELLTLGNSANYLLVELPDTFVPEYTEAVLYQIQLQGVIPIIAHPERNSVLAQNPVSLKQFIDKGMKAQVTTGSITGNFGSRAQKAGLYFIKQGLIHLAASDAHRSKGRTPELRHCSIAIKERFGEETRDLLFYENPARVINSQGLISPDIPKKTWRGLIGNLFSPKQA